MKKKKTLTQKQSLHCFENCKSSFFFLKEEKENRHPMNISASDLRGRRGRRGLARHLFASCTSSQKKKQKKNAHKQIRANSFQRAAPAKTERHKKKGASVCATVKPPLLIRIQVPGFSLNTASLMNVVWLS